MNPTELEIHEKIASFLSRYRVGTFKRAALIKGNFQSNTYQVETSRGNYILKLYSSLWPKNTIRIDLETLRSHANANAIYPLVVYPIHGDHIDTSIFHAPAVLLNLPMHGRKISEYSPLQVESLATNTASFHQLQQGQKASSNLPFHWNNLLFLMKNTLPDVQQDSYGLHGVYIEFVEQLRLLMSENLTMTRCINCADSTAYQFHGEVLSEVSDFLFVYDLPILLDVAFQFIQVGLYPNGKIDEEVLNTYIQAFHKGFPLPNREWANLDRALRVAILLKTLLIHLKKQLSTQDPLIDQKIVQSKEDFQAFRKIKMEVA